MTVDFPQLAAIRLGYGLSPLTPPPQDPAEVLAGIGLASPLPTAMTTSRAATMSIRLADLRKARQERGGEEDKEFQAHNQMLGRQIHRDLQRRIARAVDDPVGIGERLVQFWADHFTVRPDGPGQNPLAMAFVDEAIRPHVNGRFEDMFFAADTHPMMLLYLDQNRSKGPNSIAAIKQPKRNIGLNENLAREALELHTLGVGAPYTQKDVRELAELMTGLSYDNRNGFNYRPQIAEPGAETVMGINYGGDKRAVLQDIRVAFRDIARRPEAAHYISWKLAVHFVSDNPSPDLVDAMAAKWLDTDGHLPQVYRVMITHPELAATFRQKVRQPFDYVVAALRALGVTGRQVMALDFPQLPAVLTEPIARMGQRWMRPIGPDGWPEGAESWVAPQLLAARISWALTAPGKLLTQAPDPRAMIETTFGGTQSEQLAWAVPKAESQAEGVALILASNDFNRR
ncbi:DUF1800 domain-containing protein [Paracoccus aestuariivivens]|uniref:DUF1800 family protein n=1 Tax=Paracoccus aestuariivivens TaxID=1820333 RepID=A0A6L6J869_9RHOB|nr:DUF1800 domain-containing protein [Paracoccus aestuariivivens]MTH76191.1 DUF1800 family protein [Paracoccus aestuariivivens]